MAKRHDDALFIQFGACNPSGIAHSIIEACRAIREAHGDVRRDPALRLMVHQLAFLANVAEIDDGFTAYAKLMREVARQAEPATVAVCNFEQYREEGVKP